MELAKSISELNQKSWYRYLKVAFLLSFVAAQILGFFLIRNRTDGEVVAPISYKLIGRLLKEDMPAYSGMGDEQAGRDAYHGHPSLWAEYVEKYEKKYVIDPMVSYPEYSDIQRAQFWGIVFLLIALFFETVRRAFYYVVFGKIFPRKRRRRRRRLRSESTETR